MASIKDILQDKADKISRTAELIQSSTNDWQMVRDYLCNRLAEGIQLNHYQQQKLQRYQYVYDNMSGGHYTELEIIAQLQKIYGISRAMAMRDVQDAQEIFSTTISINKRFETKMELEINKKLRAQAIENGDYKAAAQFGKIISSIIDKLPEIDPESGKRFEGHTYIFTSDPRELKKPLPSADELKKLQKDIADKTGKNISMDFIEDLDFSEE